MNSYKCEGKFLKNGYIDIPLEIKKKLDNNKDLELIIITKEEDHGKNKMIDKLKKLNGLLSELEENEIKKFDEVLKKREEAITAASLEIYH